VCSDDIQVWLQQVPDVIHERDGAGPKTRPGRRYEWGFGYQVQPVPGLQARVVLPVVPSFVMVKDLPLFEAAVMV
jgi:hypothetical protein